MSRKIYISPSNQSYNTYATGKTNEKEQCHKIAKYCVSYLKKKGFTVSAITRSQHSIDYALENGSPYLRMDTNARNANARALYRKLGYREADIVPCVFNGIEGVQLVLLEKKLD